MADTEVDLYKAAVVFSKSLGDRRQQFAYLLQQAKWCDESLNEGYSHGILKQIVMYICSEFARSEDFRNDDRLIDVYQLLGKTSRSMGPKKVFEQVYKMKNLSQVARFYVLWAEMYAQEGDFASVQEIHKKALENGAQPVELVTSGFKRLLPGRSEVEDVPMNPPPNTDFEMEVDENVPPVTVAEPKRPAKKASPLAAISETSNESMLVEEARKEPQQNASAFFPENACGAFSNTLPLSQEARAALDGGGLPPRPAPSRAPQKAAFEVYYDPATPAPTMPAAPSPGGFLALSACSNDSFMDEEEFFSELKSKREAPSVKQLEEDDVTLAGYNKKCSEGPVTSTPFVAPQQPVQSAFGDFEDESSGSFGHFQLGRGLDQAKAPKPEAKRGFSIPVHEEDVDGEPTGVGLNTTITGDLNPWDDALRKKVLNSTAPPACQRHFPEKKCRPIGIGNEVVLGEAKYSVISLLGQGGFARVFKVVKNGAHKKPLALKFEAPGCPWEVYMCETARRRLERDEMRDFVMFVQEAYIFGNASAIVYEYYPHGTLLDLANRYKKENAEMSAVVVMVLGLQIAHILRSVHSAGLIHGDVKPDNFVITGELGKDLLEDPMGRSVVKLIDWGRGIDMHQFPGKTFRGRAGTEAFDCPEMLDGRDWTYQTDFFGFIAVVYALCIGDYISTAKNNGRYVVTKQLKRRFKCRQMWHEFIDEILNIPSCAQLPDWNDLIARMESQFKENIAATDFDCCKAVERFNEILNRRL